MGSSNGKRGLRFTNTKLNIKNLELLFCGNDSLILILGFLSPIAWIVH